ncbi:MAG: adenylate/guanylate cyclase domain-containing protein [Candidatus Rokubacteria bacterium]|nr:adenylate/guanylate cyclase domain-containing protein [Candidatus Rokubacteria bacterium]
MPPTPGASAATSASRRPSLVVMSLIRWLVVTGVILVSLVGLGWVGLRFVPEWIPGGSWLAVRTGVGLITELVILLGALLAGAATLTGLRRWERRLGRARAERYRVWTRERQEADRERAETSARAEAERAGAAEAIVVLDLVQSTELIREHGDAFFRDLLRRIETAFIPVARQHGTRCVDGHGDGFLFCFEEAPQALAAVREMYARLPAINQAMPPGVEVAFRASLHVGPTFADTRGNRTGLAVLKTVRLGGAMEMLHGRGAGRNSLVLSEEALAALQPAGISGTLLGNIALRGFPDTHPVYQVDVAPAGS